jgi:hypothetical protein
MRVVSGNRQISRKSPVGGKQAAVSAFQNIKRAVAFADDDDVGFAVAVVIVKTNV